METMAEPFEYNRPFVAGCIAEWAQKGFKYFRRFMHVAGN
jgi:hypothetical protein